MLWSGLCDGQRGGWRKGCSNIVYLLVEELCHRFIPSYQISHQKTAKSLRGLGVDSSDLVLKKENLMINHEQN